MKHLMFSILLAAAMLVLASPVRADPDKDESGKRGERKERERGERGREAERDVEEANRELRKAAEERDRELDRAREEANREGKPEKFREKREKILSRYEEKVTKVRGKVEEKGDRDDPGRTERRGRTAERVLRRELETIETDLALEQLKHQQHSKHFRQELSRAKEEGNEREEERVKQAIDREEAAHARKVNALQRQRREILSELEQLEQAGRRELEGRATLGT